MTLSQYAEYHGVSKHKIYYDVYGYDYEKWPEMAESDIQDWEDEHGRDWDDRLDDEPCNVSGPTVSGSGPTVTSRPCDGRGKKKDPALTNRKQLSPPNETLQLLDYICVGWFILELIIRYVFCPNKLRFFTSPLNIFDLLSIVPYILEHIAHQRGNQEQYEHSLLDALFTLKVLRIFRVFRLARHHEGLRVLLYTMTASWRELMLLVVFMLIGMVLFASMVYYADHERMTFRSIPHAFWWAIVTMTTVGYGDMVPKSGKGYFVGSLCALSGVLALAFTVPSIVNNFRLFYREVQYEKHQERISALTRPRKSECSCSGDDSTSLEKTPPCYSDKHVI